MDGAERSTGWRPRLLADAAARLNCRSEPPVAMGLVVHGEDVLEGGDGLVTRKQITVGKARNRIRIESARQRTGKTCSRVARPATGLGRQPAVHFGRVRERVGCRCLNPTVSRWPKLKPPRQV